MWIENNTDKKEFFRMDMVAVLIPCYNEAKTIEKYNKLLGLEDIIESDYYKEVSEEDLINGSIKGLFEGFA